MKSHFRVAGAHHHYHHNNHNHNHHQQQQQQQQQQQRIMGHVSLKQTAYLRNQLEVPAFLRNNIGKESENSTTLPFHQRSNSENGATCLPYNTYMLKRKDVYRPFSPPTVKHSVEDSSRTSAQGRSFLPYRQQQQQLPPQQHQQQQQPEQTRDYSVNRYSVNGQVRSEGTRSPALSTYGKQETMDSTETSTSGPYSSHHYGRRREQESGKDCWQGASRSSSPFARDYSPWRRENVDPPGVIPATCESGRYSPFIQQRLGYLSSLSHQGHSQAQDIYGSPMMSRKRFPSEPPSQGSHVSTSPQLLISRFAHQLKQEPSPVLPASSQGGSKESAKKRFASYVRLRLGSERTPSPEPPPRLSRGESPLALRRNLVVEQPSASSSPSFHRRFVSTPQPPPRRLSESNSVPGSPQHIRTRLSYTPEPQRRPPSSS